MSRHDRIFSVTVEAMLFKVGEYEKRRSLLELVNFGAARLMVRLSAKVTFRGCVNSHFRGSISYWWSGSTNGTIWCHLRGWELFSSHVSSQSSKPS